MNQADSDGDGRGDACDTPDEPGPQPTQPPGGEPGEEPGGGDGGNGGGGNGDDNVGGGDESGGGSDIEIDRLPSTGTGADTSDRRGPALALLTAALAALLTAVQIPLRRRRPRT